MNDIIRNTGITDAFKYGGSVNRENIKKILEINKLDGVLIGTISSKIEEIIKIIETV